MSILAPQKGLEIPGGLGGEGGVSQRPKILSKYIKLDWKFQRGGWGGGGLRENPFRGGGVDNIWNLS